MKLTTTLFLCIPLVNNVAASRRWHHESNIKTETLVPSRHPLPPRKRQLQDGNSTNETQPSRQWWEFGLADPVLDEVALYYLGQSWHQSADVADVLETIGRLNNSDAWSWTMEWRKTAQRMERLAQESLDGGHNLTASQAYLRASTYYRASLHRHPDPFHPEVPEVAQQAVDSFISFSSFQTIHVHLFVSHIKTTRRFQAISASLPQPMFLLQSFSMKARTDGQWTVNL